jgi:hypothetical protein
VGPFSSEMTVVGLVEAKEEFPKVLLASSSGSEHVSEFEDAGLLRLEWCWCWCWC